MEDEEGERESGGEGKCYSFFLNRFCSEGECCFEGRHFVLLLRQRERKKQAIKCLCK